jgi:AcrR family transcriptional regulator
MTTPALRVRKKELARRTMQEAALALFKEKGFEATSVDDIVDRAMFSRSTFFRYFGSKEDVVFDVNAHNEALAEELDSMKGANDPWRAVQEVLGRHILEMSVHASEVEAGLLAFYQSEPGLANKRREQAFHSEEIVAAFLQKEGGMSDFESQLLANVAIGVGRAALRAGPKSEKALLESLAQGFKLLDQLGTTGAPSGRRPRKAAAS